MKVHGEYNIHYTIFTMFNVYDVNITNHNLITRKGYEFFLTKWYKDDYYPIELGYYHNNRFYAQKHVDDTYDEDLSSYNDGSYSTSTNYIDKDTFKQYRYDGKKFIDFNEKLDKICIGKYTYVDEKNSSPSNDDLKLYDTHSVEYTIDDFELKETELILKCEMENNELDGTTEIGIKTNYGRLVSHDIHPPYNLPFGANLTLEYSFKLK